MKYSDIRHINVHCYNNIAYSVYVAHKSFRVCDGREYVSTDSEGRTIASPVRIPKYVERFLKNHKGYLIEATEDGFTTYRYYGKNFG